MKPNGPNNQARLLDTFFRTVGANSFSGVTLGNWLRILRDNRFSIDAPYWPRAAIITLLAFPNSLAALAEKLSYGRAVDRTHVDPPLFILGAWRSGTTHLHNLLAKDVRFAFPNLYQITYPLTFLLTERSAAPWMDRCVPKRRPQDAVQMGVNEPQEEDFALVSLAGQAPLLAWAFPRNAAFYFRYMTMDELTPAEFTRWKSSYRHFLQKLTYKYRRPLVLKTPTNTGRIKTLLELFPDSKFVHIHRHPYDIFRSIKHTLHTAGPYWQLQRIDYQNDEAIESQLIEQIKMLYDGYFSHCSLIPAGRLHQVAFADLERDPVGQIRGTYEALNLPDFGAVEPRLWDYVNSIADYRKNVLPELSEHLRKRLAQEWRPYFEEWGYPT